MKKSRTRKVKRSLFKSNPEMTSTAVSVGAGLGGYATVRVMAAIANRIAAKYGKGAFAEVPGGALGLVALYFITKRWGRKYRTELMVGAGVAFATMLVKRFLPGLASLMGDAAVVPALPAAKPARSSDVPSDFMPPAIIKIPNAKQPVRPNEPTLVDATPPVDEDGDGLGSLSGADEFGSLGGAYQEPFPDLN